MQPAARINSKVICARIKALLSSMARKVARGALLSPMPSALS
jgi:hypothetical protein